MVWFGLVMYQLWFWVNASIAETKIYFQNVQNKEVKKSQFYHLERVYLGHFLGYLGKIFPFSYAWIEPGH